MKYEKNNKYIFHFVRQKWEEKTKDDKRYIICTDIIRGRKKKSES